MMLGNRSTGSATAHLNFVYLHFSTVFVYFPRFLRLLFVTHGRTTSAAADKQRENGECEKCETRVATHLQRFQIYRYISDYRCRFCLDAMIYKFVKLELPYYYYFYYYLAFLYLNFNFV